MSSATQGDEMVERSIYAAAHELKSPLALMRQLALLLQDGHVSQKDTELIAQRIILTSERALRLTSDLTRSVRLDEGLFNLEPVNPVTLLEDVAHELSPLYAAKGKSLQVMQRRRSLLAVANRDLLRRVVANLVDNALHYSSDNSPVMLSANMFGGGEHIRLGVRDFGPAIKNDIWAAISSNLGLRTQALHSRPESSGLGMFVAGQFAQAMDARLGAIRHRDGATFYVDVGTSSQLRLL